jgi:multicomponent Na+:H+ antiporter subunit E
MLFAFWLVLSGIFDLKHVTLGVLSTAAIALGSRDLMRVAQSPDGRASTHLATANWRGIFVYSMWLLRAIVEANIQIARVVLDPRLPIEPAMVRVPTRVTSDMEITILANSITATPGTITVRAADEENREFVIHALVDPEGVPAAVHEIEDHVLTALRGRSES